ncbi:MAG: hypothetical protein AAB913_00865 [Patescibacteria group bacterium]
MSSEKVEKKKNKKQDYTITGVSGNFFVAAELSRRGLIATLTLKNTPLVDSNVRCFKPEKQDKDFAQKYKNNWKIIEIL